MLDRIDDLKKTFVLVHAEDLRFCKELEDKTTDLFWELGPFLWPETEFDGKPADPECYPRPLVFLEPLDRDQSVMLPLTHVKTTGGHG